MKFLQTCARLLGGDVVGLNILFPPPGHSSRDRSASVRFDRKAPGGFLVHSFAGDDHLPIRDYVKGRLRHMLSDEQFTALPSPKQNLDDVKRTRIALKIWGDACDPRGTPVEVYLRHRKLELLHDTIRDAIQYHPACPFAGKRVPAMICLVRDIVTNEPVAIHRTVLTHNGCKGEVDGYHRLSLGPVGNGAIKLTSDEGVTTCLGIGEGVESALSLCRTPEYGPSPVWALISAGGVERFPILAGIECLWIAVDNDETGARAARSTGRRWQAAGAEVFLTTSTQTGSDLNDVLLAGGFDVKP